MQTIKLISWNVNGIRAAGKKGLPEFVWREAPDVLCLQETKAHREQVEPSLHEFSTEKGGYDSYWSSAVKGGYSGVTSYFLRSSEVAAPKNVVRGIGIAEYESEGRIVVSEHEKFTLYNIYFPNGGSGAVRHEFKQKFLADLFAHLKPKLDSGAPLIVTGDYNIAHRDEDVYDPIQLSSESGFLPEERAWMDRFLAAGMIDTFRHLHPEQKEKFTWWSYQQRGRLGNRGWRIDYFCVSRSLQDQIVRADILDQVEGSDHCPVLLELAFGRSS